jgi:hypothetical protein
MSHLYNQLYEVPRSKAVTAITWLSMFIPTHSAQPHPHSDVTFHKYGGTEYLNRVWVEGQEYGMKVDPTKAETKAAANANVVEHSLSASLR